MAAPRFRGPSSVSRARPPQFLDRRPTRDALRARPGQRSRRHRRRHRRAAARRRPQPRPRRAPRRLRLDATRAAEVGELEPRRYDVLVVDADRLSSDELGDVEAIEDFVAAGGFTIVLDAEPRDHAAIADYTAFDLAAGAGGERSEMVMFGLSDAGGQEEMLIVNSGDLRPEDAAGAPDAEVRALKALAARRAAIAARRQIVADRTDEPSANAAARAAPQLPEATTRCSIDNKSLCDLSAQYTSFHVDNTPKFSAALPNGYWYPAAFQRWNSRWPKPLTQEASWQSDEFFDVYLDNDSRPRATTR